MNIIANCIITLLFVTFSLFPSHLEAQNAGKIRGFVYNKENGDPILYTNVSLLGTQKGATTNERGLYSIGNIEKGTYTLQCTRVGFDTASKQVTVRGGKIENVNLYIKPTSIKIDEVEILDNRFKKEKTINVSEEKVSQEEVDKIPAIGGEPDFAQYLQVMPGVTFSGDQGGNFYIRGGTPVQNKVVMDGMTIYNPFHSIGLFSVFDMDYIRNVDVYTGGFNAEYGNRISAIMDIQTKDGNKKFLSGEVSASPFNAKLQLEGPIKEYDKDEGGISFLFNSRVSYLNETSPVLYSYADSNGLPYQFQDFYGKVTFTGSDGSNAKVFGFNFNDKVNYRSTASYDWNATGVGTQFLLLPSQSSNTITGNFAYSDYEITEERPDAKPRFSLINGFEAGLDFNYNPGDDKVKYGFDVSGFKTQFRYFNSANREIEQTQFTTQLAGYGRYKKVLGDFVLDPSIRLQYYASVQEFFLEPRLGLKYNISEHVRLKGAAGLYSQNLMSARSDRDVVNLFYGFLSAPDDLQSTFDGDPVNSRLQTAEHAILGGAVDVNRSITLELEGYYKNFSQLTDINREKIFEDNSQNKDKPEYKKENFIVERGQAYGLDFNAKYDKKPFYFWIVYSLGYNERFDGRNRYNPHWDRRHNLNILGSYAFGNRNTWELSIRWNLGSGFPFTQTQGFYENLPFQNRGVNAQVNQANGELGIIYDDLNEGRLPYYHRLDFSLSKYWQLSPHQRLESTLSVINTYNRKNVFYFDRVRYERVNQLPILPSLSVNYQF